MADSMKPKTDVYEKQNLAESFMGYAKGSFNIVRQIDSSDCAAACLAMVAQHLGVDLVLSEARRLCGANASGLDICEAAKKLGFTSSFHRTQFKALREQAVPMIAHWHGNHWVVLLEYRKGAVKIADPAAGEYWLAYDEAQESFSGYICKVSGRAKSKDLNQRSNWLIPCLQPFKNVIFPTAVLMLLTVAAEMLIPYLIQSLIDERLFEEDATFRWLVFYTGLAGGAVIVGQGLQSMLLSKAAIKSESLVLDSLLNRWLKMPADFFKDRSFSELRLRFENVFKIRHFLQESTGVLLFAILEFIAIFAMLEHYGQAFFFAIMLFPAVFLTFLAFKISRRQAGALKFSTEAFMSCLDDLTKGIFSIRASGADSFFKELEEKAKNKMQETVRKNERALILCEKGALGIGLASGLFLFYRSGKDYMDGNSSAGTMMAILILSAMTINTIYRVLKHRESFESGAVIYDYLHDVFDAQSDVIQDRRESNSLGVKFENCGAQEGSFQLNDFSLDIPVKSSCFIFGEAELIISLLKQYSSLASGELRLASSAVVYKSSEFLPTVSAIEECPHIFNLSVYENVAMSDKYDQEQVRWYLRLVLADELERDLTYGLKTKLIESQLSYEVKMKIILARALYRSAPVYILESLSSFFNQREMLVFGFHLKQFLNSKTIIIADSDSLLSQYCTNVAIVYNGSLKGFDSSENLLKSNNAYSKKIREAD